MAGDPRESIVVRTLHQAVNRTTLDFFPRYVAIPGLRSQIKDPTFQAAEIR